MEFDDPHPSFLVLIIEIDTLYWKNARANPQKINFNDFLKAVVAFCNSYSTLHRQNQLVIMPKNYYSIDMICQTDLFNHSTYAAAEYLLDTLKVKSSIIDRLICTVPPQDRNANMSQALSKALCGIIKYKYKLYLELILPRICYLK